MNRKLIQQKSQFTSCFFVLLARSSYPAFVMQEQNLIGGASACTPWCGDECIVQTINNCIRLPKQQDSILCLSSNLHDIICANFRKCTTNAVGYNVFATCWTVFFSLQRLWICNPSSSC